MNAKQLFRNQWTIGCCLLALAFAMCGGLPSSAYAQDEGELPEPVDVQLETSDGVALSAVFYPGTNEKETVPVILVHAWQEKRQTMIAMAAHLQAQFGYAVMVPDLRGHGDSMKTVGGDELDRDRWRGPQLTAVLEDIEACKKYLINENNQGNLNIDMLSIVADRESTILATTWTLRDWSYAPLGSIKQGQDVKALVMLNPMRNFKGLNGNDAYQNDLYTGRTGAAFPVLIASTRDKSRDAKNISERMMRGRKSLDAPDKALETVRYQVESSRRVIKSRKNGDRMLSMDIGKFIEKQVYQRRHDFRWAERGSK